MEPLFDSHAHLNDLDQYPDYYCLNVTTQPFEWQQALDIYSKYNQILPALGIHPWFVNDIDQESIEYLNGLLSGANVFAVGEVGLDYTDKHIASKSKQQEVFEIQLSMAKNHQLPVSIHCQKAHNEMFHLLRQYDLGKCGVIHGLGASKEVVTKYLDLGYKIGINAIFCRENARRYHEMVANFDLSHFVLETDFPNVLLPGLLTASILDIEQVAIKIAELKNIPVEQVAKVSTDSAQSVFLR